jgi:hypothetical protein
MSIPQGIYTFQGPGSHNKTYNLAKDLGIELPLTPHWIEPYSMWLY